MILNKSAKLFNSRDNPWMKFKDIHKLSDVKFRRLSGGSWATFNLMLAELNKHLPRHIGKGRPHKLPLEDRLLLCIGFVA